MNPKSTPKKYKSLPSREINLDNPTPEKLIKWKESADELRHSKKVNDLNTSSKYDSFQEIQEGDKIRPKGYKYGSDEQDLNKLDTGRIMAGVLADFAPALKEIAELGSMNNKPNGKYTRGSWMKVEDAEVRYTDAFWRHLLEGPNNIDKSTGKHHDVAIAWNAIVLLWFRLEREAQTKEVKEDTIKGMSQVQTYENDWGLQKETK